MVFFYLKKYCIKPERKIQNSSFIPIILLTFKIEKFWTGWKVRENKLSLEHPRLYSLMIHFRKYQKD